jgi:hypothetical protein
MTFGCALKSRTGQAAVDGYCKFWVKIKNLPKGHPGKVFYKDKII